MSSRALIAEKAASLERIRAERVATARSLAELAGDVSRAVAAAEAAKLADVITPTSAGASQSKAADVALATVVEKRDAAEARADLLDKASKKLEAEIRDLDGTVRAAERAAAVVELSRRLDAGRASAREWIAAAVAAEMLRGTVVTDAGLAAIQALEPNQHVGAVVGAVYATAAALRESVDRGERLP